MLRIMKNSVSGGRASHLTLDVYRLTERFPKEELFGLTSQLRRATSSVPMNIAEGSGRKPKDCARFLSMASASINEVLTALVLSERLKYVTEADHKKLRHEYIALMRQIEALRSLKLRT